MNDRSPTYETHPIWPWFMAAAFVLIFAFGIWVIGPQFTFGEGHADRPIWTFIMLYCTGWCGLALAAALLWQGGSPPLVIVLGVAMIARGLLIDSNLIQSSDAYRYVLDGEAVLHGVNPYQHSPANVLEFAPDHFRSSLETEDALGVLARVSYPDVPTVYPPLAQITFAAGAWLSPWSWFGQRIVFLLFDIGTIALLIALLTRFRMPRAWVVLYAWNPIILKEIVNSAHVDSLATVFLLGAVYAAVRNDDAKLLRWPILCGLAIAAAVLAKLYPALLVPAFTAYWLRQQNGPRSSAAFLAAVAIGIGVCYAPFLGVGLEAMTEGFRRYAGEWRRNEGAFAVLAAITPHARTVYACIVGAGAICGAYYLYRRDSSTAGLIATIQLTLLGWFLLLPAPYPWYATSLLAFCVFRPRVWSLVLSLALVVYYYSFIHEYRGHSAHWLSISQAMEHGAIWLAIAASFVTAKIMSPAPDSVSNADPP